MKASFFTFVAAMLFSFDAIAQDGKLLDIDIDLGGKEWYEEPWAWGAGIIILILVLLLIRKSKK